MLNRNSNLKLMKKGLLFTLFTLQIIVSFAQKTERKGEFYFYPTFHSLEVNLRLDLK